MHTAVGKIKIVTTFSFLFCFGVGKFNKFSYQPSNNKIINSFSGKEKINDIILIYLFKLDILVNIFR